MFEPATKSKTEEEQQGEIYWHIFWLIETKSILIWYHVWLLCQFWHLWIFQLFTVFVLMFTSKTTSLKHVSDKEPKAKWPHGTYGNIFVKSWTFQLDLVLKSRFSPYPLTLRFLCLINSFYRRYVSCIYNIYPICTIYPHNPNLLPASIYFSNAGGVAHVQTTTKR